MKTEAYERAVLFRGMDGGDLAEALEALSAREVSFEKEERILSAGEVSERLGLVLEGSVTVETVDVWGNRTILSHVGKGETFAETYALLEEEPMLVDVVANESCRILFLRIGGLKALQGGGESWRVKLIGNLLGVSSRKNLHLAERSFHTAPKGIRGRVMAYLNAVSLKTHSSIFDIPFDRQQLADYLNVERTALSKELGRMQKDGVIRFRRSHFQLIGKE